MAPLRIAAQTYQPAPLYAVQVRDQLPADNGVERGTYRREWQYQIDGARPDRCGRHASLFGSGRILGNHQAPVCFHALHTVGASDPMPVRTTATRWLLNAAAADSNSGLADDNRKRMRLPFIL